MWNILLKKMKGLLSPKNIFIIPLAIRFDSDMPPSDEFQKYTDVDGIHLKIKCYDCTFM
jgi:hypothetical protein